MKVLVTGGAGYIGSTTCSALIDAGHTPIILDSLITGRREFVKGRIFYHGDIADRKMIEKILTEHPDIESCIHFAARIVIPESVENPYLYYSNNVIKSIELYKNLSDFGVKKFIFSSSASIYKTADNFVVTEESELCPQSPYAKTKYIMELALEDFCNAGMAKGISLRYFNPIGADPQMRSGPFIKQPSHILGKLLQVSEKGEKIFKIAGTDWNTRDGTAIRDYFHIWDLALAHVKAVENFDDVFRKFQSSTHLAINLGSGTGVTVHEFVCAFEKVIEKSIPKINDKRRPGDVVGAYADVKRANDLLHWKTSLSIEDAIKDALIWERQFKNKILE